MQVVMDNKNDIFLELSTKPDPSGVILFSQNITADLSDLVDEAFVTGVLADRLPVAPKSVLVEITPIYDKKPWVKELEIRLTATGEEGTRIFVMPFAKGRWVRTALQALWTLRAQGRIDKDAMAYRTLVAVENREESALKSPPLEPLRIVDGSLADGGILDLAEGDLAPDRPILVNQRLMEDAVSWCEAAGLAETGGAVLGKLIRLPEPLPHTRTPIVTILSTALRDERHVGSTANFSFHPEAMAEAARIAELRGFDESVITVLHTHGWAPACGSCNKNQECPLPQSSPSLQDYTLLESLFPGKATVMPIAGRKLGHTAPRPALQVHAWRSGEMTALPWRSYKD